MGDIEIEILLKARDQAQAELARLNRSLKEAGASTSGTAGAAAEMMRQFRGAERARADIGELDRQIKNLGVSAEGSQSRISRLLSGGVGGFMRESMIWGARAAGALVAYQGITSVTETITDVIGRASDLSETINKSSEVFGAARRPVEAFGASAAAALGQSTQQAIEAAASFGNLFTALQMPQVEAARLSISVVRLASDLASFHNTDPTEALAALRSGLLGEVEPLRRYGVAINEATVAQEAMRLGLGKSTDTLSEAAKVQARYSLIMQQTATAQGDFARTSTGLSNSTRILQASFKDIQAEVGGVFLPTLANLTSGLATGLPSAINTLRPYLEGLATILGFTAGEAGKAARGIADVGAAALDATQPVTGWGRALADANAEGERFWQEAVADPRWRTKLKDDQDARRELEKGWQNILKIRKNILVDERDTADEAAQRSVDAANAQKRLKDALAASDAADLFNRQRTAGGLLAETENRLEKQNRAMASSTREAAEAVRELNRAYNDLARTPVLGSQAFSDREYQLGLQVKAIDYQLLDLQEQRGTGAQRRTLARQKAGLEKELERTRLGEELALGPQRRAIEQAANPPLPERDWRATIADILGMRPATIAAERASQQGDSTLATAIAREALARSGVTNNVTISVDAGGNSQTRGGDAELRRMASEAAKQVLAQFAATGGMKQSGASPQLAGAR